LAVKVFIGGDMKLVNKLWAEKTANEIITDITNFCKTLPKEPALKPYWSVVFIKNKDELKRLESVRKYIPMCYDHPIGPVYFIGYTEEKADRWYIPLIEKILVFNTPAMEKILFDTINQGG
jgi:hypothetical protein